HREKQVVLGGDRAPQRRSGSTSSIPWLYAQFSSLRRPAVASTLTGRIVHMRLSQPVCAHDIICPIRHRCTRVARHGGAFLRRGPSLAPPPRCGPGVCHNWPPLPPRRPAQRITAGPAPLLPALQRVEPSTSSENRAAMARFFKADTFNQDVVATYDSEDL